jgi:signal transduction histidine kinase
LMAADITDPLSPAQAKRLANILASGQQLQSLMRDVMDLGSFEMGKLTVDLLPVEVDRCTASAIAAVSAQAEQAGVTLSCAPATPSPWILADADRLHQCLVNLLTNAIKYNRRGGYVRIDLQGEPQQMVIAVRDNGMGMSPQQRERLFEPFNRLGRERAAMPGAGLGLVITRQLVEAMNGQLRVESEPGRGSCLTIVLPTVMQASEFHA